MGERVVAVRGGGASYTDGYLPTRSGTVLIDSSRLTGIEVNAADMYVTVEPGVYVPGRFGIRIEDVIAITPEGHENLTPLAKDLLVL